MNKDRTLPLDFTPKAPGEPEGEGPRTLSVSELARAIRHALEDRFEASIWVEGEVSGARPAASGHMYFALKDEKEDACVDVAMYRNSITPRARTLLVDGARVRLRGKPAFWAPRGRLQFIADRADPAGRGALLEALEKLKAKLAAEGLFAEERKRPIPHEPRRIGVVTSRSGAVIHDICKVAFRRGGARILLAPAMVQGAGAAATIVSALAALQRVADVDLIIVGRGGGSADDLACFNDEVVVRAVAACRVPVVSAVGHEVDVTLTDFAADARAATPSQAAELTVPDSRARRSELTQVKARLSRAITTRLAEDEAHLAALERELGDPRLLLFAHQQTLDERDERLRAAQRALFSKDHEKARRLAERLAYVHPQAVITRESGKALRLRDRLAALARRGVETRGASAASLSARLDAMSPLKVLGRGYAIVTRDDGRAVRRGAEVKPGDGVTIRVQDAQIDAKVSAVRPVTGDEVPAGRRASPNEAP